MQCKIIHAEHVVYERHSMDWSYKGGICKIPTEEVHPRVQGTYVGLFIQPMPEMEGLSFEVRFYSLSIPIKVIYGRICLFI